MRKKMSDKEMREHAEAIASSIVVRSYDWHGSHDLRRDSTPEERKIIFGIAFGALNAINSRVRDEHSAYGERTHTVLNTAEWIFIKMCKEFHLESGEDHFNSYDSLYAPLKLIVDSWGETE